MGFNRLKTLALTTLFVHLSACSIDSSIQNRISNAIGLVNKPILDSVDHIQYHNSLTSSPPISWSVNINSTVISEYHYSIGTSVGDSDTVSWTSAGMNTSLNLNSLALVEGETYYVSVKASGVAPENLESDVISSSGWLVDVTAPTAPGIPDDGVLQANLTETNTLTWTASTDTLSGIDYYEVALGTAPGNTDTLSWTNVGLVTSRKITGLSLVSGTTYYVSVRAVDRAGNRSNSSNSDGWLAGPFCSNKSSWLAYNASGAGTQTNPYLICNAAQLANIGSTPAALSASYKLMGDIDLAPYYAAPNPQFKIGACGAGGCAVWDAGTFNFSGHFDGGGHIISNFSFVSPGSRGIGFISSTWGNASIKNLKLTQVTISGGSETGGLIGSAQYASIHNVQVSGSVTSNGAASGGIAGNSYHSVLGNSTFNGSVNSSNSPTGGLIGQMEESSLFSSKTTGVISSSDQRVGGLVGYMSGRSPSRISNSYSTSSASGTNRVGGIIGDLEVERGLVLKSYAIGTISGTGGSVGGIAGRTSTNTLIQDSYTTSIVSGTSGSGSVGFLVGVSNGNLDNSYFFSSATCDSTGTGGACGTSGLSHATLSFFYDKTKAPLNSWDALNDNADGTNDFWSFNGTEHAKIWHEVETSFTPAFSSGSGQLSDPYLLSTSIDFNKIGQNPRYMTNHFKLSYNINFMSGEFKQIGGALAPFTGAFLGDNKSLSNISNSQPTSDYVGIFGILATGGKIENLSVINATMSGRSDVGGVIGLIDSSNVSNIMASTGMVTSSGRFSGGLFARSAKSDPTRLGTNFAVIGQDFVGGIAGEIYAGTLSQSFSKGQVNGANRVGGVIGYQMAGNIQNTYSTADVNSTGSRVGGLIGHSEWSGAYDSYSSGDVTGTLSVGGGFGDAGNTTIQNVFVTGNVSGTGGTSEVGFLFGISSGPTITNSHHWSGASCDSTGVGGVCNTSFSSGVANINDFQYAANAPLLNWDFNTIWKEVVAQLPQFIFE